MDRRAGWAARGCRPGGNAKSSRGAPGVGSPPVGRRRRRQGVCPRRTDANERLRPPRASETPSGKRGPPSWPPAAPLAASQPPLAPARPGCLRREPGSSGPCRPSRGPESRRWPGSRRSPERGPTGHRHSPAAGPLRRPSAPRPRVSRRLARAPRPPQPSKQPDVRTQRGAGPAQDTPLRRARGSRPRAVVCGGSRSADWCVPFVRRGVHESLSGLFLQFITTASGLSRAFSSCPICHFFNHPTGFRTDTVWYWQRCRECYNRQ